MEFEKKRSKGSFLNLFDWNGKSRKRLFTNSNELPGLKQGKENVENLSKSQLYQIEAGEDRASSSHKLNGNWDFGLTKTSNERCGSRAPGVVARLMGLDSFPSNVPEPCSTPCLESSSLRASHHDSCNDPWNCHSDYIDMPNKLERSSGNLFDFRAQKVPKSPIERFQTEVLPPKSAKSIPITHHKLLSPIKSPGFTQTMNAGYLMEAANKIIEASPRKHVKSKMTTFAHSSVPLRIRDLKEKVETARMTSEIETPMEHCISKYRKGKPGDRNCSGPEHLLKSRVSTAANKSNSNHLKDKGKPVSIAVQAKVSFQNRGGSTSCSDRISMDRKEHNESKSNQLFKSQPSMQKPVQKRTMKKNNNILGQNNQKQNSLVNLEKLPSKPSVLNQPGKRSPSANSYMGSNKLESRAVLNAEVESKIARTRQADAKKEFASSQRNTASQKKRSVNQEVSCEVSTVPNALIHNGERAVKYNVDVDGSKNRDENRKLGMDIVSFTFTSPMKKSISETHADEVRKIKHSLVFDSCGENDYLKNLSSIMPDLNGIDGDTLSVLLEKKLQELTCKVESSHSNMARESLFACSASNSQNSFSSAVSARKEDDISCRNHNSDSPRDCECLSADSNVHSVNQRWQFQGLEELKGLNSDDAESVTNIESSIEDEFSPDYMNSIHGHRYSSVQRGDAINLDLTNLFPRVLHEAEVSNLASTVAVGDKFGDSSTTTFHPTPTNRSHDWELQYVRDVLGEADLALESLALGVEPTVITPSLYDSLETRENIKDSDGPEYFKLERKVLFDCVNECLELKFKQTLVGSSGSWAGWGKLLQKGFLAEELHKEILGWKCMEDLMLDELVEKDMSTQYGKWLNFDNEVSDESLEIEKGIFTSLVDELLCDFLFSM